MQANKRGQNIALAGLLLQLALVGLTVALWWFTQLEAAWSALWLVVAPVPIWLKCRSLKRGHLTKARQTR